MSQPTTWGVPLVGPATPTVYAARDDDSLDALLSGHIGVARPSYAVQGTFWLKDTGSSPLIIEQYFFDGTDDILVLSINVATNTITIIGVGDMLAANNLDDVADLTIAKSNMGIIGKNLIINGGFQINQRDYVSTTATADGAYMHDRWRSGSTDSSYTFAVASPSSPQTITIAANDSIEQVIEGANIGTAGTHTISWTGTATCRGVVNTQTMSGNFEVSPITVTAVLDQVITLQFTGADAAGGSTEATDTGTLGKVQCELGAVATDFEHRQIEAELAFCQRYFFTENKEAQAFHRCFFNGTAASTTIARLNVLFAPEMRAAPTLSFSGNWNLHDGASNTAVTNITLDLGNPHSGRVNVTVASGLTQFRPYFLDSNNDTSARINFDAEL